MESLKQGVTFVGGFLVRFGLAEFEFAHQSRQQTQAV